MKDYNITFCKERKSVFLQVSNAVTLQLAVSFTTDLSALVKKLNFSRIVIDIRNSKSISSASDKYSYAHEKAELCGLSQSWKIALIKEIDDSSPDFLETVMINAGYKFKIFTNQDAALSWLESLSRF